MKKLLFFTISLIAMLIMPQCGSLDFLETDFDLFTFRNTSSDSLICVVNYEYPDTLIPLIGQLERYVPPLKDTTYAYHDTRKNFFKKYSSIRVYVFLLDNYDDFYSTHEATENILKYNIEKKRYELTREWLEQHDWTVTYP